MLDKYKASYAKENLLAIDASIAMEYNLGRPTTEWMDWLLAERSKYSKIIKEVENEKSNKVC